MGPLRIRKGELKVKFTRSFQSKRSPSVNYNLRPSLSLSPKWRIYRVIWHVYGIIWCKFTVRNETFNDLKVFKMGPLRIRKGELKVTFTRPFQPKRSPSVNNNLRPLLSLSPKWRIYRVIWHVYRIIRCKFTVRNENFNNLKVLKMGSLRIRNGDL